MISTSHRLRKVDTKYTKIAREIALIPVGVVLGRIPTAARMPIICWRLYSIDRMSLGERLVERLREIEF